MVEGRRSPLDPEPELPDRMSFEAVPYWARTGIPWRDLPGEFGAWDALDNPLRRWIHSGRLKTLLERMAARPECEGPQRLMVDSTIVRARQPAAGARDEDGVIAVAAGAAARREACRAGAGSRRRRHREEDRPHGDDLRSGFGTWQVVQAPA